MKRAMFAAFILALAMVLFTNRSETIFGADASGYANLARMIGGGETTRPVPLRCAGCEPAWFIPLGFVPARPDAMASYYPIGLPLHLLLAARIGGWERAPFFVSPLAALLLVVITYRLAWLLHSELAGLIAGVLMGLCAVLLFQALQPMSDVLAAMWSVAALTAAVEGRKRPSFSAVAGLCFGMAVLVRPTSALLLLPLAFALGGWKPAVRFALGGIPAAIVFGWYNLSAFASLLASGYTAGGSNRDFALGFFPERALHYLRWTGQQFSPIASLAAIFGLALVPRRERFLLWLWFAPFFLFYSFYLWYDTWWYTRFLLPAYPAVAVAAGIAFAHIITIPRVRVVATMVVIVAMSWQLRQNALLAVLFTDEDQHRVRVPVEWIARTLPEKSLVLSMEYSGALLFYTTHDAIRWDLAPPDRALTFAKNSGRPTFALLMQHEEGPFLARYGSAFRRARTFEGGSLFFLKP